MFSTATGRGIRVRWLAVAVTFCGLTFSQARADDPAAENRRQRQAELAERQLPPKLYDIWHGKKDRLYLTGVWKLKTLAETKDNPADDPGTRDGYWKTEFDASDWEPFLVPWDINLPYPPPGNRHLRPEDGFTGVYWYRIGIDVPPRPQNTRALLFFGDVIEEAIVYVNGKLVGTHTNTFMRTFKRGDNIQSFTLDATGAVQFGEQNVIAVRGFGLADKFKENAAEPVGIWLPCWMEFVPHVYLERALLTPRLTGSAVKSRIRIQNPTGEKQTIDLRAVFSAYESYRYHPNHNVPPQNVGLGTFALDPGRNEVEIDIPLKAPILWWPDAPFLYQVVFEAKGGVLGAEYVEIGRERFGFREFTVNGDRFLLNGKSWFLGGLQPVEVHRTCVRPDYASNYDDFLFRIFKRQREVNIAFVRPHSGHYPWCYQDAADETGMLIHAEALENYGYDEQNRPTPAYRQKITESLEAYWNHPSVVCYSLGNERWDAPGLDHRQEQQNLLYDLYKEIDPFRPCGGSSGRRAYEDRPTRCDYYDTHEYVGLYYGPVTYTPEAMDIERETYYRRYWGVKPFINGECGYIFWHRWDDMEKALGAPVPDRIDRSAYAKLMQGYHPYVFRRINGIGIRNQLNFEASRSEMEAFWFKRYIEQYRYTEGCRGFNLHQSPYHYVGPGEGEPQYDGFKSAMSPLWIGKATNDRNFYVRNPVDLELLAINDSRFDLKDSKVILTITDSSGKSAAESSEPTPELANGQRARFHARMTLPPETETGTYTLSLRTVDASGQELHLNRYLLNLVRPEDVRKAPRSDPPAALYVGAEPDESAASTVEALDALAVPYRKIDSFDELDQFRVLILGARAVDENVHQNALIIHEWLNKGGKLLCLEQSAVGAVPWMQAVKIMPAGHEGTGPILVDVIADDHPLFEGYQWHQYDLWNGWRGQICDNYLLPLTDAVLASCMFQRNVHRVGMAVAEFRVGNGLCLMSQIEAVKRFGRDPIASRHLSRLMTYVLKGWDGRFAREVQTMPLFAPPNPQRTFAVNLAQHANVKRKSEGAIPQPRVWLDKAPNDLEDLPAGRQVFLGVPFEILPADEPACVTAGPEGSALPTSVKDIPVGKNVSRLFFLVCAAGVNDDMAARRARIGTLRIHFGEHGYASVEDVPLVLGENVIPFNNPNLSLSSGAVAWSHYQIGWYRGPDCHVGAAVVVWENPMKQIRIEGLSLQAGEAGMPVLLAVTAEN